jgi:hypothetical protein
LATAGPALVRAADGPGIELLLEMRRWLAPRGWRARWTTTAGPLLLLEDEDEDKLLDGGGLAGPAAAGAGAGAAATGHVGSR